MLGVMSDMDFGLFVGQGSVAEAQIHYAGWLERIKEGVVKK